jgi:uncharacterized protein
VIKARKTPTRTCVACRTSDAKRELVRVVRTPEGHVVVDPQGKANGRGAYLCARSECFATARQRRKLDSALRVTLLDDDYDRLQRDFEEILLQLHGSNTGR